MITSLNEWRKHNSQNKKVNEIAMENSDENLPKPSIDPIIAICPDPRDLERCSKVAQIGEYAKSLELTKGQTLDVVSTIFVDPSKAPEDISVAFVQDNLGDILKYIELIPEEEFAQADYNYTPDMETNDLPFECVMFVPNNDKIQKLTESLNSRIKKDNFKVVYENNIFFINSLDKLNENNKNVVLNILKECNAKNISDSLKWKRKISK